MTSQFYCGLMWLTSLLTIICVVAAAFETARPGIIIGQLIQQSTSAVASGGSATGSDSGSSFDDGIFSSTSTTKSSSIYGVSGSDGSVWIILVVPLGCAILYTAMFYFFRRAAIRIHVKERFRGIYPCCGVFEGYFPLVDNYYGNFQPDMANQIFNVISPRWDAIVNNEDFRDRKFDIDFAANPEKYFEGMKVFESLQGCATYEVLGVEEHGPKLIVMNNKGPCLFCAEDKKAYNKCVSWRIKQSYLSNVNVVGLDRKCCTGQIVIESKYAGPNLNVSIDRQLAKSAYQYLRDRWFGEAFVV